MGTIVLVTGTDTGVGKTYVTEHLVRWLRSRSVNAIALKPIETGWDPEYSDALRLSQASGRALKQTIWQHFDMPAAPSVAARYEGREIHQSELVAWIHDASRGTDICFVEGAGGWMVPFGPNWLFCDLAQRMGLPVLIVGRSTLGTINHSLLTVGAVVAGNPIAAIALSRPPAVEAEVANLNRAEIQLRTEASVMVVPDEMDRLGERFHVKHTE